MPVDMHMHSNASDGALKPAELVGLCARQGIRLMSLTDHDTMAGTAAARDAAKALGIEFVTGVEVSTLWGGQTIQKVRVLPRSLPMFRKSARRAAAR